MCSAAEAVSLADWARVEAEQSPCREFLWSDISYSEGNWTRETGAGTVHLNILCAPNRQPVLYFSARLYLLYSSGDLEPPAWLEFAPGQPVSIRTSFK